MGLLDKKNNKIRIVCAGICVIITVLLSRCSEEGSNINISESVKKYLAESELDGSREKGNYYESAISDISNSI